MGMFDGGLFDGFAGAIGGGLISSAFGSYAQNQAEKNQAHLLQKSQDFNAEQAALQRSWSASEADKARQFSKNSYKRAIQWRVKDMYKAGINPILAVGGGMSGSPPSASAPSGSSATSGVPSENSINSGLSAMETLTGFRTALANIKLTKQEQEKVKHETTSAKAKSLMDMVEAVERWMQHKQVYDSPSSSRVASETKDYPSWIKGPARSAMSLVNEKVPQFKTNSAKAVNKLINSFQKAQSFIKEKLSQKKTHDGPFSGVGYIQRNKKQRTRYENYRETMKKKYPKIDSDFYGQSRFFK